MATSITLTTNSASTEYTLATGGRGPAGATGPAGAAGTSLTAGTGIDITAGVVSSTVTGNATHTGDATGSTALTLATVNSNVGAFTNASITVNAKGLVTAASHGTTAITSITGTANQITVSGAFGASTLSLPATINVNTTGNAATVTTNANLTGPVTSTGNATAIANGAISNAMLANGAVTNLSGTNTGDETAARIATALNAGTEDSTAADTDKLAVTHPAGGWMLLSRLWTWITGKIDTLAKLDAIVADATLARTDAGQTFSGTQAFSGQIASSGSTDATVSTNVVNVATNDARYYPEKIAVNSSTETVTNSAALTASSQSVITLGIGTYYVDVLQLVSGSNATGGSKVSMSFTGSASAQGVVVDRGFTTNVSLANTSPTYDGGSYLWDSSIAANFSSNVGVIVVRKFILIVTSAGDLATTYAQATATVGQSASLKIGSSIKATKIA
jgi:hypothetical protein